MIGNKIEAVTAIYGNVKGIVLDKVTEPEVVYKYSEREAATQGMDYFDGKNKLFAISKTIYLVQVTECVLAAKGEIVKVSPTEVKRIILPEEETTLK